MSDSLVFCYQSSVFETSKISLKCLAAIVFSKYEKLSLLF